MVFGPLWEVPQGWSRFSSQIAATAADRAERMPSGRKANRAAGLKDQRALASAELKTLADRIARTQVSGTMLPIRSAVFVPISFRGGGIEGIDRLSAMEKERLGQLLLWCGADDTGDHARGAVGHDGLLCICELPRQNQISGRERRSAASIKTGCRQFEGQESFVSRVRLGFGIAAVAQVEKLGGREDSCRNRQRMKVRPLIRSLGLELPVRRFVAVEIRGWLCKSNGRAEQKCKRCKFHKSLLQVVCHDDGAELTPEYFPLGESKRRASSL